MIDLYRIAIALKPFTIHCDDVCCHSIHYSFQWLSTDLRDPAVVTFATQVTLSKISINRTMMSHMTRLTARSFITTTIVQLMVLSVARLDLVKTCQGVLVDDSFL
jgi:hypothetical protein